MTRPAGHSRWGTLCVLAASVLWGTTGTAATFAPAVGPLAIGAAAMGLGGLLQALSAARPITRHRAALHAQYRTVLLGGAAVAVYPLAFYTSMRLAGVAVGTVVSIGSAPLASALAERVIDRHRLTARWMLGAALGLAGIVLLCLAEATRPHPGHAAAGATMLGVGLGLAAGATYAIYTWAAHRLIGRGVTSRAATGAVFGLGGLLLLPVLLATGAPLVASWPNAAVGAYMALVPMFTGYLLFGRGLAHVRASTATTLSLLEPAIATVLAVLVVGEHLPTIGWVGLTFISGCLAVLTAPRARSPLARSSPSSRQAPILPGKLAVQGLRLREQATRPQVAPLTVSFRGDRMPGAGGRPGRSGRRGHRWRVTAGTAWRRVPGNGAAAAASAVRPSAKAAGQAAAPNSETPRRPQPSTGSNLAHTPPRRLLPLPRSAAEPGTGRSGAPRARAE